MQTYRLFPKFGLPFVCLLFTSANLLGQGPPAEKDPNATAIAERALEAMGGGNSSTYRDSRAQGSLTLAASPSPILPVVLKSKGTKKLRIELQKLTGTSIMVVHHGQGAIQQSGRETRKLQLYNTLARRIEHIPLFSLLSEYQDPQVAVGYVGEAAVMGRLADVIALELEDRDRGPVHLVRAFSRTLFFVDRASGMVLKIDYDNYAENDSNARQKIEIFFSDYRTVNGIWVPFRQTTYAEGVPESDLSLSSIQFNVRLSDSEFVLPE
jgi:hypothetical protein